MSRCDQDEQFHAAPVLYEYNSIVFRALALQSEPLLYHNSFLYNSGTTEVDMQAFVLLVTHISAAASAPAAVI